MGCGPSVGHEQLEKIKEAVLPEPEADKRYEGLEIVEENAKALYGVFEAVCARGGRAIRENMLPVERTNDRLLGNLDSRVDAELFTRDDWADIEKKIMTIALELDKSRSTKATAFFEERFKIYKVAKDKETMLIVNQVGAIMLKIDAPEKIVPGTTAIITKLEAAGPGAKTNGAPVADRLLDQCVTLAKKMTDWGSDKMNNSPVDLNGFLKYQAIAKLLDDAVQPIAEIPDAKEWNSVAAQLDQILEDKATTVCNNICDAVAAAIAKEEWQPESAEDFKKDKVISNLNAFKPWWKYCDKSEVATTRLAGCFKQAEEKATALFQDATKKQDEAGQNALLEFAAKLDEVKSNFEGLEAADGEGLEATLKLLSRHGKPMAILGVLEAELQKKGGQNLNVMLQSVEALANAFPSPPADGDVELVDKTTAACKEMEAWILAAAEKVEAAKMAKLADLVKRYDTAKLKLALADDSPLEPRLPSAESKLAGEAHSKLAACLTRAEEELAKEVGFNANECLEALKALEVGLDDDMKTRLEAIVAQTGERIIEAYTKATEDGNVAKVQGLERYAGMFDEAVKATESVDCEMLAKLKAISADAASAVVKEDPVVELAGPSPGVAEVLEKLDALDVELAKETGKNPNTQLQLMVDLQTLWEPVSGTADEPDLRARLAATFGIIKQRMEVAAQEAAAEDKEKKTAALVDFAGKFDAAQAALGDVCPGLKDAVVSKAATQDLSDIANELAKATGMNSKKILENIGALKMYWSLLGGDDATALHSRLGEVSSTLTTRITTTYSEAEGNQPKRDALKDWASQYDALINGLEGAGPPELKSMLKALS